MGYRAALGAALGIGLVLWGVVSGWPRVLRAGQMSKARTMLRNGLTKFHSFLTLPIVGYDRKEIASNVARKTAATKKTGFLVLGSEKLAAVITAASDNNQAVRVIDFGGACGAHFFTINQLLYGTPLRWAVVETPAMVEVAQQFVSPVLDFFSGIEAAAKWLGQPDIVHSSGAFQYVENQAETLNMLVEQSAKYILWERMILSDDTALERDELRMMADHGPSGTEVAIDNVPVKVTIRHFPKQQFMAAHIGYELIEQSDDGSSFMFRKLAPGAV